MQRHPSRPGDTIWCTWLWYAHVHRCADWPWQPSCVISNEVPCSVRGVWCAKVCISWPCYKTQPPSCVTGNMSDALHSKLQSVCLHALHDLVVLLQDNGWCSHMQLRVAQRCTRRGAHCVYMLQSCWTHDERLRMKDRVSANAHAVWRKFATTCVGAAQVRA